MPSPERVLSADEAARIVAEQGFVAPGTRTRPSVGIEMEWCTVALDDPLRPVALDEVRDAAARATLPHASRVSFEPGGQIELSSTPLPGLDAIGALAADADALGQALAQAGIGMVAIGLEPGPRRDRQLRSPRYDAMEAYFDAAGEAGRTMMRSTAALHLNLDLEPADAPRGLPADPPPDAHRDTPDDAPDDRDPHPPADPAREQRWDLLHRLGPLFVAMFANSPFWNVTPSGWRSTRYAVWSAIDARRTRPVADGGDGPAAWARYALAADVILVAHDDDHRAMPPGLSFANWIEDGHELGWPTVADLEYHLTTLFPPVRPRGWFELRMIDALPSPWWEVAAAVVTVLVEDPRAAECARNAAAPLRGYWRAAARYGLADPAFARAARTSMRAARAVLRSHGAHPALIDAVAEYDERFVARGRTPADDLLDAFARDGTLLPLLDNA